MAYNARIAVSTFFCLSGFIMMYVYGKCAFKSIQCYGAFIGRRIVRIFPLYYLSLLMTLHADMPCLLATPISCTWEQKVTVIQYILGIQTWYPVMSTLTWNLAVWSIQTEMFFYFCFPFLCRAIRKILQIDGIEQLGCPTSYEEGSRSFSTRFYRLLGIMFGLQFYSWSMAFLQLNEYFSKYALFASIDTNLTIYTTPYVRISEFMMGMVFCCIWQMIVAIRNRNEEAINSQSEEMVMGEIDIQIPSVSKTPLLPGDVGITSRPSPTNIRPSRLTPEIENAEKVPLITTRNGCHNPITSDSNFQSRIPYCFRLLCRPSVSWYTLDIFMVIYVGAILLLSSRLADPKIAWLCSIYFADGGLAIVICYMLLVMVFAERDLISGYKQNKETGTIIETASTNVAVTPRLPYRGFWLTLLSLPSIQWLGKTSFALFLFHMALIKVVWYNHWKWPSSALVMLGLSYTFAGLLTVYVEQPIYLWATTNSLPICLCPKQLVVGKGKHFAPHTTFQAPSPQKPGNSVIQRLLSIFFAGERAEGINASRRYS